MIAEILKFTTGPKPASVEINVKASQGALPKGQPMAYLDDESGWVPFDNAGDDGSENPVGFLAWDLEDKASAQQAPMFIVGLFDKSALVAAGLTAAAITAFGSRITDVPGQDLIILR